VALNSTVTVVGAATFKDDVSVSGNVNIAGNTSIGGTLLTTGDATFKTNVSVSGNLIVGGSAVITGKVGFSNTLSVTNTAIFKSGVTILGDVHVSGKVCASAYYGDGSNLTGSLPTGSIIPYAVTAAPTGYKLCDGQAHTRTGTSTSALFTVLGTLYGVGNGSTTFNVPDLRGRFMAGWNAGTSRLTSVTADMVVGDSIAATGGVQAVSLAVAQIPAHTHGLTARHSYSEGTPSGVKFEEAQAVGVSVSAIHETGGGGVHSNIPPVLMINYLIKL
jgi:microcystin-dependent protein/cytoskeletal protein CcmA (bactofilin family)